METQRTHPLTRWHPQWKRVSLAISLAILAGSIGPGSRNASPHSHAAASSPQVILPVVNHPDIQPAHQILLSSTLSALPEQCRMSLRNLYVRYDHPNQRGLAGKETVILNGNVRDAELRALFIHEFGHITDLGCIAGTPDSGQSTFHDGSEPIFHNDPSVSFYQISWERETTRKPESSPEDFVSGYATKDAFEDFAETFAYFVLQPEAFQARAQGNGRLQKKWLWMATHVFQNHRNLASGKPWNGILPWDVTKIAFIWKKNVYSPHASAKNPRRIVARK